MKRYQQKKLEITDVLLSLMEKNNQVYGFTVLGQGEMPTSQEEFNNIVIFDNGVDVPTWSEVEKEIAVVRKKFEDETYIYDRLNEYPPIEEQLDYIYHNGMDAWKNVIDEIKAKYPKSE
jgi:hypothetical protein